MLFMFRSRMNDLARRNPRHFPLPTTLGGAVVTDNGITAPILYASPAQINFQVPEAFTTGSYDLIITQSGTVSNKTILQVQQ